MDLNPQTPSGLKRWLIFNSVGAMGIAVQMGALFVLTSCAGVHYLAATALAVEAAVVHNFFWHEHWTWADRSVQGYFLRRFVGFHLANGALSLTGNVVLMGLLAGKLGLNYMVSNALAIAICSIINFLAGDRIVFRASRSCSGKEA